jgi:hypothetical protein
MGTATQSIANKAQRQQFDDLVNEALKKLPGEQELDSVNREIQLGRVFRDIINKVIATDNTLAGIKPTLDAAINKVVQPAIEIKLRQWIADGKKKEDWPFKNISTGPR